MRDPYPDDTSMVRILVTNMSAVESKESTKRLNSIKDPCQIILIIKMLVTTPHK